MPYPYEVALGITDDRVTIASNVLSGLKLGEGARNKGDEGGAIDRRPRNAYQGTKTRETWMAVRVATASGCRL